MSALELVLLDRARDHATPATSTFTCPDCDGDPDCSSCGEPSRVVVLSSLQRTLRRWLS